MPFRVAFCLTAAFLVLGCGAVASAQESIEGRVLGRIGGRAIPNVAISLQGPFRVPVLVEGRAEPLAPTVKTTSDGQGHFQFANLNAGNYRLTGQLAGFIHTPFHGRSGRPIELLEVTTKQQIKDALIKLTPSSVITGQVLDETGAPVPNAMVSLIEPVCLIPSHLLLSNAGPRASTDASGSYRLVGFPGGVYSLRIVPPAALSSPSEQPGLAYGTTFYRSDTAATGRETFRIGTAEARTIDIQLHRIPVAQIRGRLVGPAGQRMGQRSITLEPTNPTSHGPLGTVTANRSDGSFEISAVPPGSYRIVATVFFGEERMVAQQPIEVQGNMDGVEIPLQPLPSTREVRGRIRVDGKSAAPFSAASVQLTGLERSWAMLAPAPIHDNFTFTLPAVPATRCSVGGAGFPPGYYVKSVLYGRKEVPSTGLQATSDAPLTIVVSATGAARLEGKVHDATGGPAPFSTVTLFPMDRFAE